MNRRWSKVLAVVLSAFGAMAAPSLAANDSSNTGHSGQTSYQPIAEQPLAQPVGAPSAQPYAQPSTDAIIGYQPIPISALPIVSAAQPVATVMVPNSAAMIQTLPANVPAAQPQPLDSAARVPRGSYDYGTWVVGNGPYTLGRDDMIRIQVRNQPDFSGDFVVGPEGEIQYNYLGDIVVLGKTKEQVEVTLAEMLKRYVRTPQVTVTVLGYNSKAVYIVGEVNRPGKYVMRGDVIKLREAIIAAGLPTNYAALKRTHVVKPDLKDPKDRQIDLKRILYKGKLEEDIDLYPGEIVVVPSTVLHKVDVFLSDLLNPVTRSASAAALAGTAGF